MRRLVISISILLFIAFFSLVPAFAGVEPEIAPQSNTPKSDYIAELNKLGIAGRPESDNAAPYYQKAIEYYVKKSEGLTVSTRSWPKEQPAKEHALLKKWVQDNSRALEQLQLGSQKPYCWFQYTGENLQTFEIPHLTTKRQLAFALQARAKLQAEDGDITSATNDIVTLYTFGAHVAAGPKPLIEKLVGIAVKSLSIRTAFNILDKKMVDANLMKSLEDKYKQLVTDYSEPFDMRSEKIYIQEQVETDPKHRGLKPYLKSTLEYLDSIAAKTPWQLHNETQSTTEKNPLLETSDSEIPRVVEMESRIRTEEQALITTLAILRYNANSDGYPNALSQLVSAGYIKELPKDPFSDKPLVYKRTIQSFTLYSFGADYDDDGGLHSNWGSGVSRGVKGGDQVFWPLEQPQMAEGQTGRERSFARTERPQRRASTYAKSAAQPYPIEDEEEDEEEYVPVRPRQRQRTPTESLHQAVVSGDIDQVKLLISEGADINSRDPRKGWTLLHMAILNRQQAVTEFLIAKGADVNAKDNSGETPLLIAVNASQKDAVELLITKGADVNIMGGRGDNALSLAKKRRRTEIAELLIEHGAKEPSLEDMMGDRYEDEGPYPGYEEERMAQRQTRTISPIVQAPVEVDILADPNEIKARIKTFEGLEKALEEVTKKSQSEMRQWQQKRYDNKTLLVRTVQKQFEDELGFVRKVAVEEKAEQTTEAIDSLLTRRKERFKKVNRELLAQKREQRQTQAPTRGRTRYSGRSTRGRYSQRGQQYGGNITEPYAERDDAMFGTNRYQGPRRPTEPVDRETENEIRLWMQATIDKRADLAKAVHEQILIEISPIRKLADEKEAKKTTATIDGLLLHRQNRFEELVKKMEEEKRTLQQAQQDPRGGRYGEQTGRYPQTGRYRGRTSTRGGTAGQQQQQGQQTRRRRR